MSSQADFDRTPLVSIIIPTLYAKPEILEECLRALAEQNFSEKFDVWLIENRSAQKRIIIPSKLDLHVLSLKTNQGFTGAVNAGIQASSAPLVVLLNDDAVPEKQWLTELLATQRKSGADMVASTIYLADKKTLDSQGFTFAWRGKAAAINQQDNELLTAPDSWLKHLDLFSAQSPTASEPFGPDAAAALYTRKMLNDVGIFNAAFFAYLEDVELSFRARMAGYTCVVSPAIVYHHKHATSNTMSGFKACQDLKNWWRIVFNYPSAAWRRFCFKILMERVKNLKGLLF